ncbi:hypothetical protein [Leptolyngbya sp. PCC 6406]|uniref:hypothetical protein n=1 Tax=Leptolyngbya sp. PCC 6406 TaxID=1173264 RepID=UPI0002AC0E2C|nr:hypothetical protein [Leptolyngbya sp. PCC 6406]
MDFPPSPQQKRPLWQSFVAPMLFISLALHGVILLIPTGASESILVPPPDPEEEGISITRLEPSETAASTPTQAPSGATTASSGATASAAANRGTAASTQAPARGGGTSSTAAARSTATPRSRPSPSARTDTPRSPAITDDDDDDGAIASGSVPNLPPTNPPATNPNPTSPAPQARANPRDTFASFFRILSTYRGTVEVEDEEAQELEEIWLEDLANEDPALAAQPPSVQPFQGFPQLPYSEGLCLPALPSIAQWLVLVTAEGAVNPNVFPLRGTGYTSFDDAGERLVRSHSFPSEAAARAYRVDVAVDYSETNCRQPSPVPGVSQDFLVLLRSYTGPSRTTLAEGQAAETQWFTGLRNAGKVNALESQPLPSFVEKVPYTLGLCLPIAPQESWWGVLVDGGGNLDGPPQLLRSTGYSRLDGEAKDLVEGYDFPSAGEARAYTLKLPVDYNPLLCEKIEE